MHITPRILLRHGYLFLAAWVFLEQVGLPLPSFPVLLAAGALAGAGRMNFAARVMPGYVCHVAGGSLLVRIGPPQRGINVLHWLCQISLEPDSCVRRTEGIFEKQGARSLVFAKFLPGLSAVATPLAGIFHMRLRRFLLFDVLGALLWLLAPTWGWAISSAARSKQIAQRAQHWAVGWLVVPAFSRSAATSFTNIAARQKFLRELAHQPYQRGRIESKSSTPAKRSPSWICATPWTSKPTRKPFPARVHWTRRNLTEKNELLPRDREVILYCT